MHPMSPSEILAALGLYALMHHIVREDIRVLSVPTFHVIVLAAGGVVYGLAWPLPGVTALGAIAGAAMGLVLGFAARAWTRWRTGVTAFGGADVAIMVGGGGMLGLELFGPWIIASAVAAILLGLILPGLLGRRKTDIETDEVLALPFCPALVVSWILLFCVARTLGEPLSMTL